MELIGVNEVMELLNVGRPTATRMLQKYQGKSRKKGQKYLVSKENFLMWVREGGCK